MSLHELEAFARLDKANTPEEVDRIVAAFAYGSVERAGKERKREIDGRLKLTADQAAFDVWHAERMARANDPDDEYDWSDLNDSKMVFAAARRLAVRFPDKVGVLAEFTPEAVERAGKDLGIFMGVTWLANKTGIDPEKARDEAMGLITG